jgi:hypothetical protein
MFKIHENFLIDSSKMHKEIMISIRLNSAIDGKATVSLYFDKSDIHRR